MKRHNPRSSVVFPGISRVAQSNSLVLLLLVLIASIDGCSEADKRKFKPRSAEQNFSTALESKKADERRDAVVRIGEAGYFASEDAFNVLDVAARTDPAAQVRCIAIRTLGRYDDPRPVKTLLTILTVDGPGGEALPANDDVRWEAARALLALQRQGLLTAEEQSAAGEIHLRMLRTDRNRNVRLTATQALGLFRDPRVFTPLISALRSEDFMMADTAERSLMALTGVSHEYDADAWARWVALNPDPFAHAGEPVASTQPAGPTWWDKQQRVWRKALRLNPD